MNIRLSLLLTVIGIFAGCTPTEDTSQPTVKPPKPVSIFLLQQTSPRHRKTVTGTVVPWKLERIGFEQPGRVAEVIEPNEMVVPRLEDGSTGTPLARLDDEPLRIAVESARANVAVAKRNRDANQVAVMQRLPALIASAEAEATLADSEMERSSRLSRQNVISQAELDNAQTRRATTSSRVASAKADLAQAEAQQLALEAQVLQAEQELTEAVRNLRNTILYSPFPAQVSQIHAVPGTYVKEGDPVVTVQMMDPMTIEFEVTARDSRRYRRGDILSVQVTDGAGMSRTLSAIVYHVDAIADPDARTFTVTLHVRNELDESHTRSIQDRDSFAWTKQIMPLNIGPIVTADKRLLVEHSAVHNIGGQAFVWRITNRRWGEATAPGNRILEVEKLAVRVTSDLIPFLGKWNFVAIEFLDPNISIDFESDLITGELFFKPVETNEPRRPLVPSAPAPSLANWTFNRVLLDDQRWLLRSGDVAQISLVPDEPVAGFFVPMKAVREEQGRTFIHVVRESNGELIAQRIFVDVIQSDSIINESVQLRIQGNEPDQLQEGMQVVAEGTHYLNDGDRVLISPITGGGQ